MKVVILAGGLGTRISEESHLRPKPMIEVGGKPILWHIMKIYSHYGYNDFIICSGYKHHIITEYFANYYLYGSNVSFDFRNKDKKIILSNSCEPWKVTLVNTGEDTMTGGRVKRIREYVDNKPFMLTYGDGVGDIDINRLVAFHKTHNKVITVTASQPAGRFGIMDINNDGIVKGFREKAKSDSNWVNSGFMVIEPKFFDYIDADKTILEHEPMDFAIKYNSLVAYKHNGFWSPMDTVRDKNYLEELWASGKAPWRVWN